VGNIVARITEEVKRLREKTIDIILYSIPGSFDKKTT